MFMKKNVAIGKCFLTGKKVAAIYIKYAERVLFIHMISTLHVEYKLKRLHGTQ